MKIRTEAYYLIVYLIALAVMFSLNKCSPKLKPNKNAKEISFPKSQ